MMPQFWGELELRERFRHFGRARGILVGKDLILRVDGFCQQLRLGVGVALL